MLSALKTRLDNYRNVINTLQNNIKQVNEFRYDDAKSVIDEYVGTLDLRWAVSERIYRDDGCEKVPVEILKWNGVVILQHSLETLSYMWNQIGIIPCHSGMAYEIAVAMKMISPNATQFESFEDKILAYNIAKKYLKSEEDLTQCFYNLDL